MERKTTGEKRKHEETTSSTAASTVASTSRGMECPVCMEIPRANVFQCANGHSVCESCSTQVTLCPTCQSPGVKIRNHFAENLLNNIQFPCCWNQRGCPETMLRSELSAHEDVCDKRLNTVMFCSKFPEGRNCSNNFTPEWLSDPKNCTKFKTHVLSCLAPPVHFSKAQYGQSFRVHLTFQDMLAKKYNPSRLAHHSYSPFFYQLPCVNKKGKVQVLALFFLLKFDTQRNRNLSFAFVQLTPEEDTTRMSVKIKVDGSPSTNMVSQYGQNSLPAQTWSQNPMGWKTFLEMVENPRNGSEETDIPYPLSFPVSFLTEYYSNAEEKDGVVIEYTVELAS